MPGRETDGPRASSIDSSTQPAIVNRVTLICWTSHLSFVGDAYLPWTDRGGRGPRHSGRPSEGAGKLV